MYPAAFRHAVACCRHHSDVATISPCLTLYTQSGILLPFTTLPQQLCILFVHHPFGAAGWHQMLCQRRSPATHSVYQEDLVCSVLVGSMTASHSESPLFTSRGESFSWEALPFLRGRKHINQINWQLTFQPFGSLRNKNMDSQAPIHPPRMRLIDDFFARAAAPPCLPRVRPAPPPRRPPSTRVKQPRIHFGSEHEYVRIYILKAPAR